jgi:hypothetical protein
MARKLAPRSRCGKQKNSARPGGPSRAPGTYGGKVREALRIERIPATDGSSTFKLWQAELLSDVFQIRSDGGVR